MQSNKALYEYIKTVESQIDTEGGGSSGDFEKEIEELRTSMSDISTSVSDISKRLQSVSEQLSQTAAQLEATAEQVAKIGEIDSTTGSATVASGTATVKISDDIKIPPGTWIIHARCSFSSNATGRRAIQIYDVANNEAIAESIVAQLPVSGGVTNMNTLGIYVNDTKTSQAIDIRGAQNSGGDLTSNWYVKWIRIA